MFYNVNIFIELLTRNELRACLVHGHQPREYPAIRCTLWNVTTLPRQPNTELFQKWNGNGGI